MNTDSKDFEQLSARDKLIAYLLAEYVPASVFTQLVIPHNLREIAAMLGEESENDAKSVIGATRTLMTLGELPKHVIRLPYPMKK